MSTSNDTTSDTKWEILSFNHRYAVNNKGDVMRVEGGVGAKANRLLSKRYDTRGYSQVMLYDGEKGGGKSHKVHRLVALMFIGECPEGMQVNHKNGIKDDNHVENLEYVTAQQNTRHSFDVLGKQVLKGSRHSNATLDETRVYEIKRLRAMGYKLQTLSQMFGVNTAQISAITTGRQWKHVQYP